MLLRRKHQAVPLPIPKPSSSQASTSSWPADRPQTSRVQRSFHANPALPACARPCIASSSNCPAKHEAILFQHVMHTAGQFVMRSRRAELQNNKRELFGHRLSREIHQSTTLCMRLSTQDVIPFYFQSIKDGAIQSLLECATSSTSARCRREAIQTNDKNEVSDARDNPHLLQHRPLSFAMTEQMASRSTLAGVRPACEESEGNPGILRLTIASCESEAARTGSRSGPMCSCRRDLLAYRPFRLDSGSDQYWFGRGI